MNAPMQQKNDRSRHRWRLALLGLALALVMAGCGGGDSDESASADAVSADGDSSEGDSTDGDSSDSEDGDQTVADTGTGSTAESSYLDSYTLADDEFGTMVTVTVNGTTRTIETNALPDHETGEFPNSGNPNTITAQDLTWEFPTEATLTGEATEVRTPGVAVNGVKFEPGTAETISCSSGETSRIEALQDVHDLGLDFNNAHVQPTGEYHYHGISQLLVEAYEVDEDLVHVGFAADGHLIYYSKSGAYESSYELSTTGRTGTDCVASGPDNDSIDLEGTTPDGTYDSDWIYTDGAGDLDSCNGTTIDGTYAYLITDAYPYVSRCLMGEVAEGQAVGAGPPPGGDEQGAAPGGPGGAGTPGAGPGQPDD